jgi:NAD(P)H-hydrate epimerase
MRRLDEATISHVVPGITLMERAGLGVLDAIAEYFDPLEDHTISIFLGSGNNAGDGLVVGRLLAERRARVILHYCKDPKNLSPDAFKNYARLKKFRTSNAIEEHFLYLADWEQKVRESLEDSDLVVDALFGTGIDKPITGIFAQVIEIVNESDRLVLSVDVPSGVNGSTGEVMNAAVNADLTVTMGLPKMGLFFYPGRAHTGGYRVIDIGIPDRVIEEDGIDRHLIDFDQALEDMPAVDPASHKFQRGSLLIVAGSRRYTGAAHLASLSALRTGCGIVYCAGPESIRPVIQASAPEVIFIPLPETDEGTIHSAALETLAGEVKFDAAAVGPGLTTNDETVRFVRGFVSKLDVPVLLDADGINSFQGAFDDLKALSKGLEIIVSPHSGELKRLTGGEITGSPFERIERLCELVEGTNVTLVHKGAPTVIAHPSGRSDVNGGGHPGQATAGSGDVLTGAIGGFLAQGCGAEAASRLGVYLHSHAAMIAAQELGERGMLAGDCMEALPLALQDLEEEEKYG